MSFLKNAAKSLFKLGTGVLGLGVKALFKKKAPLALPGPVTRDDARDEAEREEELARRRGASANIVSGVGAPGGLGRLVVGS